MNLAIKSDLEIIRQRMSDYRALNTSNEKRLMILEDLEYYVHQV